MGAPNKELNLTIVRWIDDALMVVLSVFCLTYVTTFGRTFAETSVQFRFLNFPVFVGEFLLAGCAILFFIRMSLVKFIWGRWSGAIILFLCFILIKALWGYAHRGPLALRDAALFYYTFFAVIAYTCYRPGFFDRSVILIFYGVLMWLFVDSKLNELWHLPRLCLGLILAYKFPDRRMGVLMAAAVILLTPYYALLNTSRSIILGNFAALSLLLIAAVGMVDRKVRIRFLIGSVLTLALLGTYVFYFSGYRPAQGIFAFDKLKSAFEEMDLVIQEKKSLFAKKEVNEIALYNPNSNNQEEAAAQQAVNVGSVSVDAGFKERFSSTEGMKIGNSVFRLLLWRDAAIEMLHQGKVFGFDFGKPFRSESLEIIRSAVNEWSRDGWIAMHNSYLNILYRAGIVGIVLMGFLLLSFVHLIKLFIRFKSVVGLLLCASLVVPLTFANFAVTLELPYSAIPIWSLFGLTLAYAHQQSQKTKVSPKALTTGTVHAHSHCS